MIRVSDLVMAVAFLSFFLLTNKKENTKADIIETQVETVVNQPLLVDSLSIKNNVYDSYAEFAE